MKKIWRLPARLRSRTLGYVVGTLLGMILVFVSCAYAAASLFGGFCGVVRFTQMRPPTTAMALSCGAIISTVASTPVLSPNAYRYTAPTHLGGTLTYADWRLPASTNPWFVSTSEDREVEDALWGSPLVVSADGKFLPDELLRVPTVTNGDVSVDGLTVTMELNPNLKWSDGQPLTAADFIYWLSVLLDPRTGADNTYGFDQLASYTEVDPHTLSLRYKQPFASYLDYLPDAAPRHAWSSIPDQDLFTAPAVNLAPTVTSGPFMVSQMVSNQSITMVPDRYYASTTLHPSVLNTLIFKTYQTKDDLMAAYQTGQIDHAEGFTLLDLPKLNELPGLQIGPSLFYEHLDFNLQNPALQDVHVRKAIEQAIDRCALVQTLFQEPCDRLKVDELEPVPHPDADPTIQEYPFNLNAARADMQAAGWDCSSGTCMKAGAAFPTLTLARQVNSYHQAEADFIKQHLVALGIPVKEGDLIMCYSNDYCGPDQDARVTGQYDLALSPFDLGMDSDANLYPLFHSSQIPSAANPYGSNYERVNDPQVDRLLDEGRTTLDQTARSNVYKQLQRYLIQQVYIVPLYLRPNITLTDSKVGNYFANPLFLLAGGNEWNIGEWYDKNQAS